MKIRNMFFRTMRRALSAAIALTVVLAGCGGVFAVDELPSGIPAEELGSQIESFVSDHSEEAAGMAVAVFDTERMIYQNSFGYSDVENRVPVDSGTVFEWGSVSKLLLWLSVMQLWERGEIDLNADVREYLPENFLTKLRYEKPVTMLNLMNHNAGFGDVISNLFIQEGREVPDLETALKKCEPVQAHEPGAVTAYSNWGTALAGYIIQRIAGQDYAQYVREHIFDALGMERTAIRPDLSDNDYVREKRGELKCYTTDVRPIEPNWYAISLYPAGMCTGTMGDFTLFARALLERDPRLLSSPDTWEEMFSPSSYFGDTDIARVSHGFWTVAYGDLTIGHGGNTAACSSYLLLNLKNGVGSVVMTNQAQEHVFNMDMMELIYGSFEDSELRKTLTLPKGIYKSARVVEKGALKLSGIGYMTFEESDLDQLFTYDGERGVVSYAYGDYLRIPTGLVVLELGLLLIWAIGLLFSLGCLLAWPVGAIAAKIKKRKRTVTPGAVDRRISAGLQMLLLLMIAGIALSAMRYAESSTYVWMPAVCAVTMVAMLFMAVRLSLDLRREKGGKEKLLSWAAIVFLLAAVGNILYWDLYMFWVI